MRDLYLLWAVLLVPLFAFPLSMYIRGELFYSLRRLVVLTTLFVFHTPFFVLIAAGAVCYSYDVTLYLVVYSPQYAGVKLIGNKL